MFFACPVTSHLPPSGPLTLPEALRQIQSQARYLVRTEELARTMKKDPRGSAITAALNRLAKAGRVVLLTKKPSTWLIVPPEQAHYGAPPVQWWLHDFLNTTDPDYYVALLSAARHWGSGHYALQTVQVALSRQRAPLVVGKLRVEFIYKKNAAKTPVEMARSGVAPLRVSTREATLLDLLRHQSTVGGLEATARIAKDFAKAMSPQGLKVALEALGLTPPAQRLGYILEQLRLEKFANTVEKWLAKRRPTLQPLEPSTTPRIAARLQSPRWALELTMDEEEQLGELA